ncbi:MAG: ABC transporter permease [Spirochaetales bacterium]|nr:ABC transporter permease [Spirochaetales bacterium]
MTEDIINAIQSFLTNKTRSILSLLGVVIGVAAVIMVTAIGESASADVKSTISQSGLDMVNIRGGNMRKIRALQFDETTRREILQNVPHVKNVFYKNQINGNIKRGNIEGSANINAIELDFMEESKLTLDYGRYFEETDNELGSQCAIIGQEIATSYFPDGDVLGKKLTVTIKKARFSLEIIGVLQTSTSIFESSDSAIYVTRGFYKRRIKPNPIADSVVVQATSNKTSIAVEKAIKAFAEKKTGESDTLFIMSMQTVLENYEKTTSTLNLLLSGVAAISLLVGGIGIMNIMIVSVTERKREIGIRKALGASQKDIRNQFLIESAMLSLIGGTIGILVGTLLSFAVVKVLGWKFSIPINAAIISFIFSAFVGIFFGLSPAVKAAKLDPVVALASE